MRRDIPEYIMLGLFGVLSIGIMVISILSTYTIVTVNRPLKGSLNIQPATYIPEPPIQTKDNMTRILQ